MDVTEVEPLSPDSKLWDDEKVIITPHVGAQSFRRVSDTTDMVTINLQRFLKDQELYNRVDKKLGFPHPSAVYRGESQ